MGSQPRISDVLYGLLTFQTGMISREELLVAAKEWGNSRGRDLRSVLLDSRLITVDASKKIDRALDEKIGQHQGVLEVCLLSEVLSSHPIDAPEAITTDFIAHDSTHNASHDQASSRSVLCALVAVENDWITSSSLRRAIEFWSGHRDRSLEDLLAQNMLTPDSDSSRLTQIADELLRNHGHDVERCLLELAIRLSDRTDNKGHRHGRGEEVDFVTANRYVKKEEFARGGQAILFHAEDQELGTKVALKEVRPDRDNPGARQLLIQEARTAAMLAHKGIPPVYSMGIDASGRPFYAMKYIGGSTLLDHVSRFHKSRQKHAATDDDSAQPMETVDRLDQRDLIGFLVSVCDTVQRAHDRDRLHCDLKPANVKVDEYGEVVVLDWGLAEVNSEIEVTADSLWDETSSPSIVPTRPKGGTLQYMAPEQAAGYVTRKTDVFSLGAILFHILNNEPPIRLSPEKHLIRQAEIVRDYQIVFPRRSSREVPEALKAICMKALRRDPKQRYESANQLKRDLERWLKGKRVSAWDDSPSREPLIDRASRFATQRKSIVSTAAAALIMLAVTLGWTTWFKAKGEQTAELWFQRTNSLFEYFFDEITPEPALMYGLNPSSPNFNIDDATLDKAVTHFEQLIREREHEPDKLRVVAGARFGIGRIRELRHERDKAKLELDQARVLLKGLIATSNDPETRILYSKVLVALGRLAFKNKQYDEARELFTNAHTVRKSLLVGDDLKNNEYNRLLANTKMNIANIELRVAETIMDVNDPKRELHLEKAKTELTAAKSIYDSLVNSASVRAKTHEGKKGEELINSEYRLMRRDKGRMHYNMGRMHAIRKNVNDAGEEFKTALSEFDVVSPGGGDFDDLFSQMIVHWQWGELLVAQADNPVPISDSAEYDNPVVSAYWHFQHAIRLGDVLTIYRNSIADRARYAEVLLAAGNLYGYPFPEDFEVRHEELMSRFEFYLNEAIQRFSEQLANDDETLRFKYCMACFSLAAFKNEFTNDKKAAFDLLQNADGLLVDIPTDITASVKVEIFDGVNPVLLRIEIIKLREMIARDLKRQQQ